MSGRLIAVLVTVLGMSLAASAAQADTGDVLEPQSFQPSAFDGFQAVQCTDNGPGSECSPQTPDLFFKTAGGHPPAAFFTLIVRHLAPEPNVVEPVLEPLKRRAPRTVRVDLPPGLMFNPEASAEKCTFAEFSALECKSGTIVGGLRPKLVTSIQVFGIPQGGDFLFPGTTFPLWNLQPRFGEPALFGTVIPVEGAAGLALLEPEISFENDYHASVLIRNIRDFQAFPPFPVAIHTARLIPFGNSGDGTFVTQPTTCFNPAEASFSRLYSSWVRVDSHEQPNPSFPAGSTAFEAKLPFERLEGCESVPFDPSIEVSPGTKSIDSPAAPTVTTNLKVEVPSEGGGPIATSHLRKAEVTLPTGMGLNPAGSKGLVACTDAQFHKGDREFFNECPPASVLGTAAIKTPLLSETLEGDLLLAEPKSTDPVSGEQFRVFLDARLFERGIIVRLIGRIKADPRTGQLTAVFDDQLVSKLAGPLPRGLPQVPLESIELRFDPAKQLLTSPPTCSRATTTTALEPWARPGTQARPLSSFTLTEFPGGRACPPTPEERPFAPAYTAKSDDARAGSSSPFRVRVARFPGEQELKQLTATLPKGLVGKLVGIPYCPEAALAAAVAKSGSAELRAPSCSGASLVGTTQTESGSGADPLKLAGKVYLAGPYGGAPLSMATITPALSGPFDLGNVVVRVALHLDPRSAQITAVSDPFPDVFGGVKLSLRAIDLNLDRPGFMLNPTNCSSQAIAGSLRGGGANPADPATWSSHPLNTPFGPTGCEALGFAAKLVTKVSGPTKRGKYPRLTATLATRLGDANLARAAVDLPRSFFVAQEHISTICTNPQLTAKSCPASSAYGQAEASSPLLDGKLVGPVYLVPGGGQLPDLVADLDGQVDVQLRGEIKPRRGRISVVFASLPDVPVTEFNLAMAGGKKGLLVNSKNICKGKRTGALQIEGQNGKQLTDKKYKLKLAGCKKRKKRGK